MDIEFTRDNGANNNHANDGSNAFRDQLFNVTNNGEKFNLLPSETMTAADSFSHRELLERNAALLTEINNHADRLATAAIKTLSGVPAHLQESFFEGISCFNDPNDVVYNAVRDQWNTRNA